MILPPQIWKYIATYVHTNSLFVLLNVNKQLCKIVSDVTLWRAAIHRDLPHHYLLVHQFAINCGWRIINPYRAFMANILSSSDKLKFVINRQNIAFEQEREYMYLFEFSHGKKHGFGVEINMIEKRCTYGRYIDDMREGEHWVLTENKSEQYVFQNDRGMLLTVHFPNNIVSRVAENIQHYEKTFPTHKEFVTRCTRSGTITTDKFYEKDNLLITGHINLDTPMDICVKSRDNCISRIINYGDKKFHLYRANPNIVKCVTEGVCTRVYTDTYNFAQVLIQCTDCNRLICETCAKKCHRNCDKTIVKIALIGYCHCKERGHCSGLKFN